MTPATTHLLELLGQMRGASRLGRTRILALAAKALRDLTPQERRVLATEATSRVAPHLLPQVEDLVQDKLGAAGAGKFVELFNQLDGDAIADLARDVALALDGPPVNGPIVRGQPDEEDEMDLIADVTIDDAAGHTPPIELVAEQGDLAPALDEPRTIPAGEHEDLPAAVPMAAAGEHEDLPAAVPVAAAAAGLAVLPRPTKEELVPALDEEPTEPPVDPVSLLRAEDEGWRRRRLAQRLIERGNVLPSQARALLEVLRAPSDRAWIAGALVDARLVELGEVLDLLPQRTHASLWRRAGW